MPATSGRTGSLSRYGWLDAVFYCSDNTREVKQFMKRWMQQILVLIAWLANTLLGLWVMIVVRQTLLTALAAWYVGESFPRAWRARFYDRAYFVVAGLIYLIAIFLIDGYLRDGLAIGDTFRRFVHVTAIGLLMLFPADLVAALVAASSQGRGLSQASLVRAVLELVAGAALLAYAIRHHPKRKPKLARGETI